MNYINKLSIALLVLCATPVLASSYDQTQQVVSTGPRPTMPLDMKIGLAFNYASPEIKTIVTVAIIKAMVESYKLAPTIVATAATFGLGWAFWNRDRIRCRYTN